MVPLIELAQGLPWLYLSLIFLFSLMVGSFLNVVIHRLPIMMERAWHAEYSDYFGDGEETPPATGRYNLMVPRSRCPHCDHPIGQGHETARQIEQQATPEQGQGELIRQEHLVQVDEGQCDQCPGEQQSGKGAPAGGKRGCYRDRQQGGEQLDQGIASRNGGVAVAAAPPEP